MKELQQIQNENQDIKTELEKFIIWNKANRKHWERCFIGSKKECEQEFKDCEYTDINEEICKNQVNDQWEDEVDGMGYLTFATGETISYTL